MRRFTRKDFEAALPDLETSLRLPGLNGQVLIFRDPWGIPHIQAESNNDLFFAQGFATAQDRLWHMDYDRMRALGRWSEWVGRDGLAQDRLLRAAGMGRTARLDYQMCRADTRSMIDAYTDGVNAFIESTESLPIEYTLLDRRPERWESWHCLTVYKMRNTLLGTYEAKLFRSRMAASGAAEGIAKVVRGYPAGHLLTVPPGKTFEGLVLDGLEELLQLSRDLETIEAKTDETLWSGLSEDDGGSNAWAISGKFTDSGLPMVGGDSHRELDTPNVYYQVHLVGPEFSIIGSSVPGVPGVLHFCHNEHVAWGMTYGAADTQDLFLESFRTGNGGCIEYLYQDNWQPSKVLNEVIRIKGGSDAACRVVITHHGPVIAGDPQSGWGVTVSDPGLLGATQWPDSVLDAMRCHSVEELHQAFAHWTDRVNNYATADVHGNYGYLHEGKIPVRGEENGWRAVPGWSGSHEWKGYIPQSELPKAINPDAGYAVTCNQRVSDASFPYFVGLTFYAGFRASRVQKSILALPKGKTVPTDMAGMHSDRHSEPAQVLIEALLKVLTEADGLAGEALTLLRGWNYEMDRERPEPAIYSELKTVMTERVARLLFGRHANAFLLDAGGATHIRLLNLEIVLALQTGDDSLLPRGGQWSEILSTSFTEAIDRLRERMDDDVAAWKWGAIHCSRHRHPLSGSFPGCADLLNPAPMAVHGDGDTPLASNYGHGSYTATSMSVNRYLHDPSDWSRSLWIVPLGASGHPASPHYADQAKLWADVEYIPQLWDWSEIEACAETVQQLAHISHRDEAKGG